jgi:hypothetical protein
MRPPHCAAQARLRLAFNRDALDASSSSIEIPVTAAKRRKFLPDGMLTPFIHSQTVGCLTPTESASPVCEVPVSDKKRFKRSIGSSIGLTYVSSIGRTYDSVRHPSAMPRLRSTAADSFMGRALLIAAVTHGKDAATVSKIAEWAGVSQPSASGWKYGPKIENAVKLALAINANVEFLYTGRGEMLAKPPADESLRKVIEYWPTLSDTAKGELVGWAGARATPEPKGKSLAPAARRPADLRAVQR